MSNFLNIKQFFHEWCMKTNRFPTYKIAKDETRLPHIFCCEVFVDGMDYRGIGNGSTKKEAKTNAAKHLVSCLIENKIMSDKVLSVIRVKEVSCTMDFDDIWSLENAKARLNLYLSKNNMKPNYNYLAEPDKAFICELNIFCPNLMKNIIVRKSGLSKQFASRSCALSLARQLFYLKVIKQFKELKPNTEFYEIPSFKISVDPKIEKNIDDVIDSLGLVVMRQPCESDINMIINSPITETTMHQKPQIICWSPSLPNWNAWTTCNINNEEYVKLSLNEISQKMKNNFIKRLSNDKELGKIRIEREKLHISSYEEAIIEAIFNHQIVIIKGEAGSGKTTQVPQFILDYFINLNRGAECNIIITQQKRISTILLAERVASERRESVGESCGYSVRFDTVFPQPYGGILYCTVGTLLRKFEDGLRGISHVIIDDINEIESNIDFLLIILRDMTRAYPKLKLILMGETMDVKLFKNYFHNIFCIDLKSRAFPFNYYFLEDIIEIINFNPDTIIKQNKIQCNNDLSEKDEIDVNCNLLCDPSYKSSTALAMSQLSENNVCVELIECLLQYIENTYCDGTILIFLPDRTTIERLFKKLNQHPSFGSNRFLLLPFHSRVPRENQHKIFQSSQTGIRKIILSTNISENSISINDVVFVIDSCHVKINMSTPCEKSFIYNTTWISKRNIEQRRACAGRIREGHVFHLCSRYRYSMLPTYISDLQTNLYEIVLLIKLLNLGNTKQYLAKAIVKLPFNAIMEAEYFLKDIKALDKNYALTSFGKILGRLPIEPNMGKMIIYGCLFGVADACVLITACKSLNNVFVENTEQERLSRQQMKFAAGRCSDHMAVINAFQNWENLRKDGNINETVFCEKNELNLSSLKKAKHVVFQIKQILFNLGIPKESLNPEYFNFRTKCNSLDNITSLLVFGLYPNVCYYKDNRNIITSDGKSAFVYKSSVNCNNLNQVFSSPIFIFKKKILNSILLCNEMTMINPLQLLMFGARKVIYKNEKIVIDEWLNIDMNFNLAAKILTLRSALEALFVKVCVNPKVLTQCQADNIELLNIFTKLSDSNVCNHRSNTLHISSDIIKRTYTESGCSDNNERSLTVSSMEENTNPFLKNVENKSSVQNPILKNLVNGHLISKEVVNPISHKIEKSLLISKSLTFNQQQKSQNDIPIRNKNVYSKFSHDQSVNHTIETVDDKLFFSQNVKVIPINIHSNWGKSGFIPIPLLSHTSITPSFPIERVPNKFKDVNLLSGPIKTSLSYDYDNNDEYVVEYDYGYPFPTTRGSYNNKRTIDKPRNQVRKYNSCRFSKNEDGIKDGFDENLVYRRGIHISQLKTTYERRHNS